MTNEIDRLDGYTGYERATTLFNEQLTKEDKQAWREQPPDEPHPGADNRH